MILFTILFLGCGDNKESEIPEITTDGTSTSCSGTAPVIQEIICSQLECKLNTNYTNTEYKTRRTQYTTYPWDTPVDTTSYQR